MLTVTLKLEGNNQEVVDTMKNFLLTLEQDSVIEADIQVPISGLEVQGTLIENENSVLPLSVPIIPRRTLTRKKRYKEGQEMLILRDQGKSIAVIGKKFGVTNQQASNIIHYERVVRPSKENPLLAEVEIFPNPTEIDIRNLQIIELHKTGMMPVSLGNQFNLRPGTVSTICWRAKKEGWY